MKKASTLLTNEQKAAVSEAVRVAEKNTSAEIVPVVATSSGRYDRAEDIFGLLTGLATLAVAWIACPAVHPASGWEQTGFPYSAHGLIPAILSVLLGFIVGGILATRFPLLRLPFIPAAEIAAEVEKAAHAVFASHKVRRTAGSTGILLYVSLYEHRVVVLPDEGISSKVDPAAWQQVCDQLLTGLKQGAPDQGLITAVQDCGTILAEYCPGSADDVDELRNDIILIDN